MSGQVSDEKLAEMLENWRGHYSLTAPEKRMFDSIAATLSRRSTDGEAVAWVTADILAAMKRGDRAVSGWKQSADFCIPLYTHPAPIEPVAVKALEWEQGEAACPYGLYSVHNPTPLVWSVRLNGTVVPGGGGLPNKHAATTFAQADFDQRIRSALQAKP